MLQESHHKPHSTSKECRHQRKKHPTANKYAPYIAQRGTHSSQRSELAPLVEDLHNQSPNKGKRCQEHHKERDEHYSSLLALDYGVERGVELELIAHSKLLAYNSLNASLNSLNIKAILHPNKEVCSRAFEPHNILSKAQRGESILTLALHIESEESTHIDSALAIARHRQDRGYRLATQRVDRDLRAPN